MRAGTILVPPAALGACRVRSGVSLDDFLRGDYDLHFALSFLVSPGELHGERVFLMCDPSGWAGAVAQHPSATLVDFLAQHDEANRDAVTALAHIDEAALGAAARPADRVVLLLQALSQDDFRVAKQLTQQLSFQRYWSNLSLTSAAAAMPLLPGALRQVRDPMQIGDSAVDLVARSRRWARVW